MRLFDLPGLEVAVTGIIVLIALSCVIGLLEACSLRHAWGTIARERRESRERRQELDARQQTLDDRERRLARPDITIGPEAEKDQA